MGPGNDGISTVPIVVPSVSQKPNGLTPLAPKIALGILLLHTRMWNDLKCSQINPDLKAETKYDPRARQSAHLISGDASPVGGSARIAAAADSDLVIAGAVCRCCC